MSGVAKGGPTRFRALDSLRGICACMIVLLHLRTFGYISQSSLVQNGFLFVDFFFVLSGFVIAASYGDKISSGFPIAKFMGLRFGRVYPLHLFVLLVFLLFELFFATLYPTAADRRPFDPPNSMPMFAANLVLLQTFIGPDGSWNGPSWSIAVEVWTYLIYALVFRFARAALIPLALVLAVTCCAYLPFISDRYMNVFHEGALIRCLFGFSLGVICFELSRSKIVPKLTYPMATVVELAVAGLVVIMISVAGAGPLSLAIPPVFFIAVFVFSNEEGAVSQVLKRSFFLLLGTLSYSIYMIHGFLEYRLVNGLELIERLSHGRLSLVVRDALGNHIGGSPAFGDFMSIVMLCIAVGAASISYRWIEKPAQDWSRRKILGSRPSPSLRAAEANAPAL